MIAPIGHWFLPIGLFLGYNAVTSPSLQSLMDISSGFNPVVGFCRIGIGANTMARGLIVCSYDTRHETRR